MSSNTFITRLKKVYYSPFGWLSKVDFFYLFMWHIDYWRAVRIHCFVAEVLITNNSLLKILVSSIFRGEMQQKKLILQFTSNVFCFSAPSDFPMWVRRRRKPICSGTEWERDNDKSLTSESIKYHPMASWTGRRCSDNIHNDFILMISAYSSLGFLMLLVSEHNNITAYGASQAW